MALSWLDIRRRKPCILYFVLFLFLQEGVSAGGWDQVIKGGFGHPGAHVSKMIEFNGQLYVALFDEGKGGCRIWRSPDGLSWEVVVGPGGALPPGFGDSDNQSVDEFVIHRGWLFASTWNEVKGAQLWRSRDGAAWELVVGAGASMSGGFGKLENSGITALETFSDTLFAGTGSLYCKDGVELWVSKDDGVAWEALAGERVAALTALARESKYFLALEAYDGHLYVSTGDQRAGGAEIWRTRDGRFWEAVVGAPSPYRASMGNPEQDMIDELRVFKGCLYAGVRNYLGRGGALWRTCDGTAWDVISGDANALYPSGLGDAANFGISALAEFSGRLYLGTSNEEGSQLWLSEDGLRWEKTVGPGAVISSGFGNAHNQAISALVVFKGYLYAGTANRQDGAELWRFDGAGPLT